MAVTINGSTGISGVDGSAATPALQGGDTNTGIIFGTDTVGVSTGGVQRTTVDSSGRLLVGTSSTYTDVIGGAGGYNGPLWLATNESVGTGPFISTWTNSASLDPMGTSIVLSRSKGNAIGTHGILADGNGIGTISFNGSDGSKFVSGAIIRASIDGTPGVNDLPTRLVFSTTADGASSPTERMRLTSAGMLIAGDPAAASPLTHHYMAKNTGSAAGTVVILEVHNPGNDTVAQFFGTAAYSTSNTSGAALRIGRSSTTSRSINAGGTINASGADYAEYMPKTGDLTIAKGDVCGVTSSGKLTTEFAGAISFVVKSTNPSYVGGDTWGSEDVVGKKPEEDDADAFAQWEADLEAARQKVDRIAFAGQVPVNVMSATPGQYIVPVETADGGIEGVAKNEADLTLAEYMRAVGKVIAIEADGRARIIVKVA